MTYFPPVFFRYSPFKRGTIYIIDTEIDAYICKRGLLPRILEPQGQRKRP